MNANHQALPTESYAHSPASPFQASDIVFHLNQLTTYYDAPGAFAHVLEGQHYGFLSPLPRHFGDPSWRWATLTQT